MNCLYGVQSGKDNEYSDECKSQKWMQTEYDDNILDFWRLPNGIL